jgi:Asp-tRNA(Asn)/Glu-tRNA(Gln) amidotransferase A subunit family amidase
MTLNRLTGAEAARRIAAGQITVEALVRDCLERIAQRDGELHAWVHCDPDAALAQARAIDRDGARGPLFGLPVGVKDVIDTCDMPTQYGSPIYDGHAPRSDAACVALVRQAGGIVLGKTVTTEFATRHPRATRNPHDLEHTPGGSSSGSAAAVADFMAPLAFGTQTGGSTIRPSAYCGIVGYKPSFGTINAAGMKHVAESLDTIGVMARTVEDCALLVNAVSGRILPDLLTRIVTAPRIAFCRTSRWDAASDATHAALEAAASLLARSGAPVTELALPPDFDRLYPAQELIMNFEAARALAHERRTAPERLSDTLRATLDEHEAVPRSRYDEAMALARGCRHAFDRSFRDVDVLLTPSAPDEAPQGLASTGSSLFNRNWTLLGVPCVTVPFGRGAKGLPLGLQIVGRYDDDARVLKAAEFVRQAVLA